MVTFNAELLKQLYILIENVGALYCELLLVFYESNPKFLNRKCSYRIGKVRVVLIAKFTDSS